MKERTLALEGIVQIGLLPQHRLAQGSVELSKFGGSWSMLVARLLLPGVFAAGDVTTVPTNKSSSPRAMARRAALSAFDHLIRHFGTFRSPSGRRRGPSLVVSAPTLRPCNTNAYQPHTPTRTVCVWSRLMDPNGRIDNRSHLSLIHKETT